MTPIHRIRNGTAAALAALLLPACALIDREVRLTYPPTSGNVAAAAPAQDGPAVSVTASDARAGVRGEIGAVRNGFYMKTASVTTTDDAARWVQSALERELGAAGYRVVPRGAGTADVEARIQSIDCDAFFTYSATVLLDVRIGGGAAQATAATVTGEGGAGMNWTATEVAYGESLALALQNAAQQIVALADAAVRRATPARP